MIKQLKQLTPLQWIGIIILFNTTLLGGASQLGDLSLSAAAVKAILAIATLGNGFLGGLVTMFGGQAAMTQSVVSDPASQEAIIRAVLAMPGVQHLDVNAKANAVVAKLALDPTVDKIAPTPQAVSMVTETAKSG